MAAPTGKVFSWGANSYGQLGLGNVDDSLAPHLVQLSKFCPVNMCGGGGHTFFIDEKHVYACGQNSKGQLGLGIDQNDLTDKTKPLQVAALAGLQIFKLVAGCDFSLALTDQGDLLSWGSNSFHQLGLPNVKNFSSNPTRIALTCKVKDIAAGLRHSAAVSVEGNVYTWGTGRKGQLGLCEHGESGKPCKVADCPQLVSLPAGCGQAQQVVCGAYHTAVLTDSGQVCVWGNNKHGQVANDPDAYSMVPSPSRMVQELFHNKKVTSLHSGWTHLLACTEDGCIYSWGRNDYGQLGRSSGDLTYDPYPKVVADVPKPILQLSCGSEHNLVLTGDGSVFCWGWNEHGICGTGDETNVPIPRKMELLKDVIVSTIATGCGHSLAVGTVR